MNEVICKWSSDEMYAGRLMPAEGVRHRLLGDLPTVQKAAAEAAAAGKPVRMRV
jgi:hypothetical protein